PHRFDYKFARFPSSPRGRRLPRLPIRRPPETRLTARAGGSKLPSRFTDRAASADPPLPPRPLTEDPNHEETQNALPANASPGRLPRRPNPGPGGARRVDPPLPAGHRAQRHGGVDF